MMDGPLAGAGVLITRPAQQSATLEKAIEEAGGIPILFPAIDIVPRADARIESDFNALPRADIVIFVSTNAVQYGVARVCGSQSRIAAIGATTNAALAAAGIHADIVPNAGSDSEHLLAEGSLQDVAGLNILIVRGTAGRELLAETLRQRGARVDYLPVYERNTHQPTTAELHGLEKNCSENRLRAAMVMSVASLQSLLEIFPASCTEQLQKTRLVAPSARVIQTALEQLPGALCVLSAGPGAMDMTAALIASLQENPESENG